MLYYFPTVWSQLAKGTTWAYLSAFSLPGCLAVSKWHDRRLAVKPLYVGWPETGKLLSPLRQWAARWFQVLSTAMRQHNGKNHTETDACIDTQRYAPVLTHTHTQKGGTSATDSQLPLSVSFCLLCEEMMNPLYEPVTDTHTHTNTCEHQRVVFCDPLEFIPSLPLPPAFDLNQRGCDLTVMNAETYHTAQSENVHACVVFNIPVINRVLFDCAEAVSLWCRQTPLRSRMEVVLPYVHVFKANIALLFCA